MKRAGSIFAALVIATLRCSAGGESQLGASFVLDAETIPRPCWVLVLSGGGARGLAQIGVLRVLEREQLYPSAVVGTSIGAIIGGLWCAGYRADDIDSLLRSLDWQDVLRLGDERSRGDLFLDQKAEYDRTILSVRMENFRPIIPEAASSGQRLERLLATLFWRAPCNPSGNFDRLRIPFCAVATDLVSGQTVAIRSGDLATAVRASSTFPLRYTPVRYDSLVLVDGGLLANIPVHVAREQFRPHLVVAVNTTSPLLPPSALDKPWNVADQVVTLMMERFNARATLEADLTISPQLGEHSTLDFRRIEWLIAQGEQAGEHAIAALRDRLDQWVEHHMTDETLLAALPRPIRPRLLHAALRFGAVEVRRDSAGVQWFPVERRRIVAVQAPERWLADSLQLVVGQNYTRWLADSIVLAWNRRLRAQDSP